MTTLTLRGYQKRSLATLDHYLGLAAEVGAKRAFIELTDRPYRSVPALPDLPYVCLRIPTGGGKTLMAAHAVGIATGRFLQRDQALCLWLVPSDAILEQTLARLRDVNDPYHVALKERLKGPVSVLSLTEALAIQRETLDGESVVIVSTLAALRIGETEERKVYKQNGALGHHFANLSAEQRARLDHTQDGHVIESLANVLRLRRPMVVVDEAHNARTPLSFTTLARFAPSCVVEFTATPATTHNPESDEYASNVLTHVSALELKADEMVKLPVQLVTRTAWTDAVGDALAMQHELELRAAEERTIAGEYIRPIVLFQAQPHSQHGPTVNVEALEKALVEDFRIPREHIAVETGTRRDLAKVNIFASDCPVRYVITVQALREGWDCPWAYILCSVAELSSPQAVEQLLGRVLRMPRAVKKHHESLNKSYAFIVSQQFLAAAKQLKDALVDQGFERYEVESMVAPSSQLPLFSGSAEEVHETVTEVPALARLAPELRDVVRFNPESMTLTAVAQLSDKDAEAVRAAFATPAGRESVGRLQQASATLPVRVVREESPAFQRQVIAVPQLVVQEDLSLVAESPALDFTWKVAGLDANLDASQFLPKDGAARAGEIDVDAKGEVKYNFRDEIVEQLLALEGETGWTPETLAVWLDAHIPHPDLDKADAQLFILKAVEQLVDRGGVTLDQLARLKFRLRNVLAARIAELRVERRRAFFELALFGPDAVPTVTSEQVTLEMGNPERYAPNSVYDGSYQFKHHLFPQVGELKSDGEEFDCAAYLDAHPEVEVWVRNLERRPATSFWLPTSTDRFYPDFIARTKDKRIVAVEYKGSIFWSNDDSKEKRQVGDLWAARSGGKCVFVMPNGPDWYALDKALRS